MITTLPAIFSTKKKKKKTKKKKTITNSLTTRQYYNCDTVQASNKYINFIYLFYRNDEFSLYILH